MEQNGSGLAQGPFCPGGALRGGSHLSGPGLGASGQLGWPTFGLTSQSLQMKQGVCTKM